MGEWILNGLIGGAVAGIAQAIVAMVINRSFSWHLRRRL